MKFHFKIQPYQTEAVEAVVRIFQGQPKGENDRYRRDLGTIIDNIHQQQFELPTNTLEDDINRIDFRELVSENGYKNTAVRLTNEQLLHNIQVLQAENNLAISDNLVTASGLGRCSLDIEMETGTGKTYVYIKTMFELNKRYGWSKFIVVVPSIAIREGVKKSFEITADHFHEYYGQKARFFVYDSDNLTALDSFSSSSAINVMIINTQAFNTSMNEEKGLAERGGNSIARIIYSKRDSFGSRRPIDVIAANRPILILDEPQKMGKKDSKTQKALRNFNPLFIINYSATHAERHNLIYVLDALDAYNKKLVKKIEVKGFEVKNLRGTDKYLYLQSIVLSANHAPRVKLELEVAHKSGIKREIHTLEVGDNLYYESNNMEQYKGLAIIDIDPYIGTVIFTNGEKLHKGEVVGDASEKTLRRVQIRETILSHIEKEKKLFAKGIKTLSLFFIDEVAKYRQYDENGQELLGEYGQIFEEEYAKIIDELCNTLGKKYEKYLHYLRQSEVHKVHRGYFSIDKKGRSINSSVKRGTDISDDISAYDLILKNKERLLSFDEPTRFIFSHSALREGWDNPNIFQICTLKRSDSTVQKRQEVGRGLRLCVNKQGTRMDADVLKDNVHNVNVLTVIASESYAEFVGELQKQIREVLYNRPTKASIGYFEGIIFPHFCCQNLGFYLPFTKLICLIISVKAIA